MLLPDSGTRVDLQPLANRVELAGALQDKGSLRYTPAGVPALEFRVAHNSRMFEAGSERKVECVIHCVSLGETALLLRTVDPGMMLKVVGFLADRSLKQKTPVLHVSTVEFIEQSN